MPTQSAVEQRNRLSIQTDLSLFGMYLFITAPPFNLRSNAWALSENSYHENEAFLELQNYADFQTALSGQVRDEIARGEMPWKEDYPFLQNTELYDQHRPSRHSALRSAVRSSPLSLPIIIPQRNPGNGGRTWQRTYVSSLMECGIDESVFDDFLDALNEASKVELPVQEQNHPAEEVIKPSRSDHDLGVVTPEPSFAAYHLPVSVGRR